MNAKHVFSISLWIMTALPALAQSGGRFTVTKSTIDTGGGTCAGGRFVLAGTIGQSGAEPVLSSVDQRFQFQLGFWEGLSVVQTAGAPWLKLKLLGQGQALLSWPVNANGFTLEEIVNIAAPNSWSATPQSVVDTASEHTVTVSVTGNQKLYRLKK